MTTTAPDPRPRRRWVALVFIALAQLMVALDATVVNIALPSAQSALHASDAQRQWVITAYTLSFAGLLLLGGRIADRVGRRRALLTGLLGFAAASALGGAAPNLATLLGARALQGAFAALLTPTALSLLAVTFTEPRERARAFAVYGGIAGSGGALGLILGGVLTQYLAWRWCLYVNVPVALIAAAGGRALLDGATGNGTPGTGARRFDITGALLAIGGLVSLVYACSLAASDGWGSPETLALLGAGGALVALFVLREATASEPMLPLRILRSRNRAGAYVAVAGAVAAMYGAFLLLTYEFQAVLHYSPVRAGLAFLPLSGAVLVSSGSIASRLLPRVPPRVLMAPGLLVAAGGMLVLSGLDGGSAYVTRILPAEILMGLGAGCLFVPAFNVATQGVSHREAGVASAAANTFQQVGASIGAALLNTIAAGATTGYLASHAAGTLSGPEPLVHGYAVAAGWCAAILASTAVAVAMLVNAGRPAGDRASSPPARQPGARPAGTEASAA